MCKNRHDAFSVNFPSSDTRCKSQDEEFCTVRLGQNEFRIRFHDYHEIYKIPGLYEYLFHEKLKCSSPKVVTDLLIASVRSSSHLPSELSVLDVGAGNGIVGEFLKNGGIKSIVGIDIIPEAFEAALRDRPGVYDEYYIEDLLDLSPDVEDKLKAKCLNALVTVGALGFGDIPARAFAKAYNFIVDEGWIAFNIKEDFLEDQDATGFCRLIRKMTEDHILKIETKHSYCHRLSLDGKQLYYMAVIGTKQASIPEG
jgi:SAM-dependent methyltransferase